MFKERFYQVANVLVKYLKLHPYYYPEPKLLMKGNQYYRQNKAKKTSSFFGHFNLKLNLFCLTFIFIFSWQKQKKKKWITLNMLKAGGRKEEFATAK